MVVVAILAINYTCLLRIHILIHWFDVALALPLKLFFNILASRSHWVRIPNDFNQHCKYVFPTLIGWNCSENWTQLETSLPTQNILQSQTIYLSISICIYLRKIRVHWFNICIFVSVFAWSIQRQGGRERRQHALHPQHNLYVSY